MLNTIEESKILILDDVPANVQLLRRAFTMRGYVRVEGITDARRALETCKSFLPDILILDLRMPFFDGFQVMDQLQECDETREIPVIVVTADRDRTNALRALERGAVDYVEKPFEPAEVLMRVHNALERGMLLKQAQEQNAILERKVAERTRDLEQIQEELVERLLLAVEYRDCETGAHISRIGQRVYQMALLMGLSVPDARVYKYAGMMHDIGKIAIPDQILLKPGKLTPEEFELMKEHTTKGAALFAESEQKVLKLAAEIAATHHERWDGTGYPSGLSGMDIPLGGRIVAVFDVLDALISERPYKKAWPEEDALREIRRLSGSAFDPEIVSLLMDNLELFTVE